MARTGVFGRLPRAAPDLTNTVVALVREAQAMLDQNMVDAWKSGGKVDGKGVDDDRLLRHMKKRRDQLDPSDPAWDEWNNNYIQYDFAIHESKMALKNDQGKISDAAMARFYKKWAGREDVQKDSEFYRSLLSRAAKWNAAAKARSAGRRSGNSAAAHASWVNGYHRDHVKGAETATGYLLAIAETYGATPPNPQSLDDINTNSTGYGRFLDAIDGKVNDPVVQGIIDEATRAIRATNPNFKWGLSNVNDLLDRGDAGLKRLVIESTSDSERNEWRRRRETLRYEKTRVRQARANERIQIAADTYADDLDACAGNPYCARNATRKFRDKLVKYVPDVAAGVAGGLNITGATADVKTASALANTIRMADDILADRPVKPPSAAVLGGAEKNPDYTIFDAAAGNDSPGGQFGFGGNRMNEEAKMLDRGGWIMTTPKVVDGVAVLDGAGLPEYDYVIYDANTPQPPGLVPVPGVTLLTDQTRAANGPEGPSPVTVTPTAFVAPAPPSIVYVGADGNTLTPQATGEVRLFSGDIEVNQPAWVELPGVKGPDGKARTLYRTGTGTDDAPYLFHELPPTTQGAQRTPSGQFVVPTTLATDADGKQYLKADIKFYLDGAAASRAELTPGGSYVFGTFASAGGAGTAQAISDLFTTKQPNAGAQADKYLREFQRGIEALRLGTVGPDGRLIPNPEREAGQRDYNQLSQTVGLYKQGKAHSVLGDAYNRANDRDPKAEQYLSQLSAAGFTVRAFGQGEVDRRMDLLAGIDAADERMRTRKDALAKQSDPYAKFPHAVSGLYGTAGALAVLGKEQAALGQSKKDVFNPTISVSNIKVPGMPGMFQPVTPSQMPGRFGAGGWGQRPFPAPRTITPTPTTPPAPRPPGPETMAKPPKPPEPREEFKPPKVAKPPPAPRVTGRRPTPPKPKPKPRGAMPGDSGY